MKFKLDNSSVGVLGIAGVSLAFSFAIVGLESTLANPISSIAGQARKPIVKQEKIESVCFGEEFIHGEKYSSFVPEVYAIKTEEDKFVLDWRALGSKYI